VLFRAISTETVPNVTGHHFDVFCTKLFFDNKRACCNRRVFFSVMHSCCCLTGLGLGLGLNILVLFLSLLVASITRY